ncbi:MAG TPA: hypothetical protein VGU22_07285 [Methylomirabilota bacterium]|jgi:hypothetical protein|nr:hypothetical protein [Methylomirabilota bacterium]
MKVFMTVLIVTAVWIVLARVLSGGVHAAPPLRPGTTVADAWMWEEHDRVVSLTQDAAIPRGHPLTRIGAEATKSSAQPGA